MIKIGIHNSYASVDWRVDYYELIDRVSKIGVDSLQAHAGVLMEMPKQKRQDIKKFADDKGVELTYCYGLEKKYDLSSEDESIRKNAVEYMKNILRTVGELQGRFIVGCIYSYWPFQYTGVKPDREKLTDLSIKSVKECIKVAEDFDIDFGPEVLNRFEHVIMNTAQEGVEYVKRIESPRAKLNLDTFHMNIEEDSFEGSIETAKDYLVDLHVGENNRRYPGMGILPWDKIIGALKDIDYDGSITMEPFMITGGEIGNNVYLWRDLTNNASRDEIDAMAKDSLKFLRDLVNK